MRRSFLLLSALFFLATGLQAQSCIGDTILYEDFANGFSGNNSLGLSWDTSGTYQAWRDCPSNCTSNGPYSDVGPLQSSTDTNGYVNLDIQNFPTSGGPAPEQHLEVGPMDLSSISNSAVLRFQTAFEHCCAAGHELQVQVSTDGGTTWSDTLPVLPSIDRNEASANPEEVMMPLIAPISANPSNVSLRFTWPPTSGVQISGVYNWYIDDVVIKGANRNDLSMEKTTYKVDTATFMGEFNNPIEYTALPHCNVPALQYGAEVCNVGGNSVSDAKMQVTVIDSSGPNIGSVVYQESSAGQPLDSLSCIGGNLQGYRPPGPDTVWASPHQWDNSMPDTGTYVAQYRAILGDSADCDTSDNKGVSKQFRITEREYAVDEADRIGGPGGSLVSPQDGGGGYKRITGYNFFEFIWFDGMKDTIKYVYFYVDDTTEAGAGPVTAGICPNASATPKQTSYGMTESKVIQSSDVGSWVKWKITRDGQGNPLPNGLPVDTLITGTHQDTIKTAFVHYPGGGKRFGFGTAGDHGDDPGIGSWVYGDLGGSGEALYRSSNIPMLRLLMNKKDGNCQVASAQDQLEERGFFLGQNRPNPATGKTTIAYELEEPAKVSFIVRDVTGKLVHSEDHGQAQQGRHRIELNSSKFDAGMYYYTLQVDGERATKKMLIAR